MILILLILITLPLIIIYFEYKILRAKVLHRRAIIEDNLLN